MPADPPRICIISSCQAGADRGALLGVQDVWGDGGDQETAGLTTGGYAPLGYKCDDYIQESDIDREASASIEGEKKYIDAINEEVAGLIKRFRIKEYPNEQHKVKFSQKDKANAEQSDVVVAFRSLAPNSGAGTEQTVNYACFGVYNFVEQFKNNEEAGGALQRSGFVAQPGWPSTYLKQVNDNRCLVFSRGKEYSVLDTFTHTTPKDEAKSKEKGKDVFATRALTQRDLLHSGRKWSTQVAKRSALVVTLGEQVATDTDIARRLSVFLMHRATQGEPLKVMVSGPTEKIQPGAQQRVRSIFADALKALQKRKRTTMYSPPAHVRRFHLISGLQFGSDRGALLGAGDIWDARPEAKERLTTGGYLPLGYKCDDYIQESDIDPLANPSIEGEKKWLDGPINQEVRGMIEKFGVKELPNEQHKVKFAAKDMANADACDVLVAFRSWAPNSGAGTEQTVNYGVFGEYIFAEQFRNGDKAGGALQRVEFLAQEGWPAEHTEQSVHSQCIEFKGGQEYSVVQTFTHETPKDEQKSAEKGKAVFKMQAVTQADLLSSSRTWARRAAKRSAIVFTLAEEASDDHKFTEELADFLRRHGKEREPLKIMVSGPTEKVAPGTQDRARAIFKGALSKLL